jgi:hypothetical protein
MLRNFLGLIVTAGALVAPAIADEPAKNVDGKTLLTATQMDTVTAGGLSDAFANVSPDMIEVITSGDADNAASSSSRTTLNITYNITPDGIYKDPTIEIDYTGAAAADNQQATVVPNVVVPGEPAGPGAPEVTPPSVPEPVVLTRAQQFAKDNALNSRFSIQVVNSLISQLRNNARNNALNN